MDGLMMSEDLKQLSDENEWRVECSDDETYGNLMEPCLKQWIPPIGDIIGLYKALEEKRELKLEWMCPGRRSPSPETKEIDSNTKETPETEDSNEPRTAFDFDDMFNETTIAKIAPRRTPGLSKLKGSGQKRVASFENVMFDIRRQMRLERLDSKRTSNATNKKASTARNVGTASKRTQ